MLGFASNGGLEFNSFAGQVLEGPRSETKHGHHRFLLQFRCCLGTPITSDISSFSGRSARESSEGIALESTQLQQPKPHSSTSLALHDLLDSAVLWRRNAVGNLKPLRTNDPKEADSYARHPRHHRLLRRFRGAAPGLAPGPVDAPIIQAPQGQR